MLYVVTAIKAEAEPFLSRYAFHPVAARYGRIFLCEQTESDTSLVLVLTGPGLHAAVSALTEALTLYPPKAQDLLLNIGICGAPACQFGGAYRIHKITDFATGLDFYPDILQSSAFREAPLVTFPNICDNPEQLTDMEASGIFYAGRPFFSPDRMFFYKAVSDCGTDYPTPQEVTSLIDGLLPAVLSELNAYSRLLQTKPSFSDSDENAVKRLLALIDASVTMEHEVWKLAEYLLYREDVTVADYIEAFLQDISEPFHRKEGKILLEKFRRQILS